MLKNKKKKGSPLRILVSILAVVTVILFVSAFFRIMNSASGYRTIYSTDDYIRAAEYNRFDDLYNSAIYDMKRDQKYSPETEELRSLAFYFETALVRKAYNDAGEVEKAKSLDAKLNEYAEGAGTFSSMIEKIESGLEEK